MTVNGTRESVCDEKDDDGEYQAVMMIMMSRSLIIIPFLSFFPLVNYVWLVGSSMVVPYLL